VIREHELIIYGDEAWTRQEWERRTRPRPMTPEQRQRRRERRRIYMRDYYARNLEHLRAYNREWKAHRQTRRLVGSLHSLACQGPTKDTGCRCSKIRCYSKPR
jgi:hypothetical protein